MSDNEVMLTPRSGLFPAETPEKNEATPAADDRSPSHAAPVRAAFFRGVKAALRRVPVTTTIVALNLLLFAGLAFSHGGLLDFNGHALLAWGADYGPRTFGGQWWRLLSSMFLHDGLAHLSVNLLFFLLAAPLAERLLGPFRFAFVYLFAGLGARLWTVGWFPSRLSLGASGAVFGVYGSLLGCALRAPRTIPWRSFRRQVGLLVLFTLISLVIDYLDRKHTLISHGSGLLYGFAGGLLLGPILSPRKRKQKLWGPLLGGIGCLALLLGTAAWVQFCARPTVDLLTRYQAALDVERDLSGRFEYALTRWEDGKMNPAEFGVLLETQLIPQLEELRQQNLGLPHELAGSEKERLSLFKLIAEALSSHDRRAAKRKGRSSEDRFDDGLRFCLKCQLDTWKSLAEELKKDDPDPEPMLLDHLLNVVFRAHLDDIADGHNLLHDWLDFSGREARDKRRHQGTPHKGLHCAASPEM
jgi:membrane associated rhomboid family serine protease